MLLIVIAIVVIINSVLVDGNTAAVAVADAGADVGRVAASADERSRRHLWNEYPVTAGIGRHRMRARGLTDRFDQLVISGADHAEHRAAGLPIGRRVVAPVALVEPDLVGADDAGD